MKLRLKPRLILSFLLVGLIPFTFVAAISLYESSAGLSQAAFNQLEGVRGIKKMQVEAFFNRSRNDVEVLTETVSTLRYEAFQKLSAIRQVKKNAIEGYFNSIRGQVVTFSQDRMIIDAMQEFKSAFKVSRQENNYSTSDLSRMKSELRKYYDDEFAQEFIKQNSGQTVDIDAIFNELNDDTIALQYDYIKANANSLGEKHKLDYASSQASYNDLHRKYHPSIRSFLEEFGYYDIFLLDPDSGNIVYSVFKELDFATSLIDGPYAGTNFGQAFQQAKNLKEGQTISFVDFKQYLPSYNAPASFIASPIYENNSLQGVLIFQMPLDRITGVMSERAGLGKTGETYLIGADKLMRSDSYLDSENHSVSASFRHPDKGTVDTKAGNAALNGETGTDIILDYNGNPVLSAYAPLDILGVKWGILAEIDVAEAFVPLDSAGKDFYSKYVEKYGYYDLFLMNPDGYIFYSAAKEADFETNIVEGEYKDSGLGKLVGEVLKTGKYGFSDFSPYAPSNGDPASFIAQPLIGAENNKVEMVIALQISLDAINSIMQQREGMGETGETYLVGSDKLMRSDSFLDPAGHSVKASFAVPATGSVETVASDEALAGMTDTRIIIDYNGNPVLSAFTPIKLGHTTWALIAEIDESEAFAAVNKMQLMMLIIAIIGVSAVIAVGYLIARNIGGPIASMTNVMGELAANNLMVEVPYTERVDELGEMAVSVDHFKSQMVRVKNLEQEQEEQKQAAERKQKAALNQMAETFEKSVGNVVDTVTSASTELQASASEMSSTAIQTSSQATAVASAAEEASTNVQTVASATTELSSSEQEISRQIHHQSEITDRAAQQADTTINTVEELVSAVTKIGEFVGLITDIAEQTNLLALNATIEAARAGDSGKGFAVVASEVKNLATQTASATEEITGRIKQIQSVTQDAAKAIGGIRNTIVEVDETANAIAAAVEEQTAATHEICRNIEEASRGTQEVSVNIQSVQQAAGETGAASNQISTSASELSVQAETLREEVQRFLSEVRSGGKAEDPALQVDIPVLSAKVA